MFLTFVNYFTLKVFLGTSFHIAYLVVSVYFVLSVVKFHFATNPLVQGAHHSVVVSVCCIVELYCLAVVEDNCLVACGYNYCRVYVCFYGILVPTVHNVLLPWTFDVQM